MSEIVLNRHGIDVVGFELSTVGDNVASVTLNDLLLDPSLDYMLRVQELNAPVSGIPLFGFESDTTPINRELFRVKKRVAGTSLVNFNLGFETTTGANNFDSAFRTQGPGGQIHYNVTGFLTSLGKHANNFTQLQDVIGVGAGQGIGSPNSQTEYLRTRLNGDGCVELIGTSDFWNNFCLQFTDYGVALLGITNVDENNILALTTKANNQGVVFTMFDFTIPNPAGGANLYVAANNNVIDPANH